MVDQRTELRPAAVDERLRPWRSLVPHGLTPDQVRALVKQVELRYRRAQVFDVLPQRVEVLLTVFHLSCREAASWPSPEAAGTQVSAAVHGRARTRRRRMSVNPPREAAAAPVCQWEGEA